MPPPASCAARATEGLSKLASGCRSREGSRGQKSGRPVGWSAWSVDVAAVLDTKDDDLARVLADPVEHAVGAASR